MSEVAKIFPIPNPDPDPDPDLGPGEGTELGDEGAGLAPLALSPAPTTAKPRGAPWSRSGADAAAAAAVTSTAGRRPWQPKHTAVVWLLKPQAGQCQYAS